jgi:hypothetical protein
MTEETQTQEAPAATEETRTRGQSLLDTRNKKMAALFKDRHYKISKEVHLEPGQVFKTEFGHKGRHGFVLLEVDAQGNPATPEFKHIVGASVLKVAHEDYEAIYGGLPENFGKSARQLKAEAAAKEKAEAGEAAPEPETVNA